MLVQGMDFSRVQASGVSTILLKGQQYTAPPNIKGVRVTSHWHYKPGGGPKWLDVSAILCDADGCVVEIVDWCWVRSRKTAEAGAVSNSGLGLDDYANNKGMQVLDIKLTGLGESLLPLSQSVSQPASSQSVSS